MLWKIFHLKERFQIQLEEWLIIPLRVFVYYKSYFLQSMEESHPNCVFLKASRTVPSIFWQTYQSKLSMNSNSLGNVFSVSALTLWLVADGGSVRLHKAWLVADGATVQRGLVWLDTNISEFSLTKVKPKVGFEAEMIISCFQSRVAHL